MEYRFSDRVSSLKPSAIREIFKYAADPSVVSLSAGNPSPDAFPSKEIAEISAKVFAEDPISVLQYSVSEGYTPLRKHLTEYMKKEHNTGSDNDDILITTGAQQIMDLCSKALVNEGDVVICEAPSFIGSLNTFRSYNAKLAGVPVEPDGMSTEKLEEALKANPNAKLIYTIPNFQNPSGVTMSLEKRKKVYELAKKYGVLIIEDNPYGDLRYSGEYVPNIKSFDTNGIVIYAGSFSKVISPGMRVAYTIAPKPIFKSLLCANRATMCIQTSGHNMYAMNSSQSMTLTLILQSFVKSTQRKRTSAWSFLTNTAHRKSHIIKLTAVFSFGVTCPRILICRISAKNSFSKRFA